MKSKIQTESGKFGTCYFMDCLEGMIQQKVKVDLVIADPPYGVDIGNLKKNFERLCKHGGQYKNKLMYNDQSKDYEKNGDYYAWIQMVFLMAKECAKQMIITPGEPNLIFYLKTFEIPSEIMIHYKSNCISFTHGCRYAKFEHILVYGKLKPFQFHSNVFAFPLNNGFRQEHHLDHPCPKTYDLWYELIQKSKPTSVCDPFLGSGTTAQVCESLGISWIGFETNLQYRKDIQSRIKEGMLIYAESQTTGLGEY